MAKLYEIAAEISDHVRRVGAEENFGEITQAEEERLDSLNLAFEEKMEHCCRARAQLEADAAAYRNEAARLTNECRKAQAHADWLKSYCMRNMMIAGLDRVDTELFKLRVVKNSVPSVQLAPGAFIPTHYQRVKVELNAAAVADDYKHGLPMPDGIIVKEGCHLRIN